MVAAIRKATTKSVISNVVAKDNYSEKDGLIYFKGSLLYVPEEARVKVLEAMHDNPLPGHLGRDATTNRLRIWFTGQACPPLSPNMSRPAKFVNMLNRIGTRLRRAQILPRPRWSLGRYLHRLHWRIASKYQQRRSQPQTIPRILVVVDRFSKMAYFLPCWTDLTAQEFARILFKVIITRHGRPLSIVSDRDKLFTSGFWQTLTKLIATKTKLSTACHSQTMPRPKGSTAPWSNDSCLCQPSAR